MLSFLRTLNVKSIGYLFFIQIGNVLIPFLILPILARELGSELLGEYVFLQIISLIAFTITDFSVEFSGVKQLSGVSELTQKRYIVYRFQNCKLFLGLVTVLGAVAYTFLFDRPDALIAFALIVGVVQGMSYSWAFLALEIVERIAIFEFVTKLAASLLIVYLAISLKDLFLMMLVSLVLYGIHWYYGYWYLSRRLGIKPIKVFAPLETIRTTWPVFFYKIVFSFNIVLISLFVKSELGAAYAGYFINSERLARVCRSLLHPFSRVLFATIAPKIGDDYEKFYVKSFNLIMILSLIAGGGLAVFSEFIVLVIFGSGYEPMNELLILMAALVPLVMLNNNMVLNFYISLSKERSLSIILLLTLCFSMLVASMLIPGGDHYSAAICCVLVETFMFLMLFSFKKIHVWC